MKMLITLGRMVYFVQICMHMDFEHCPATDMQNGDKASPSIILARQALLMKMLITLELRRIFC